MKFSVGVFVIKEDDDDKIDFDATFYLMFYLTNFLTE